MAGYGNNRELILRLTFSLIMFSSIGQGSTNAQLTSTIPPNSNMCTSLTASGQTSLQLSTNGIITMTGPSKTTAYTRTTTRSVTTSTKSTSGSPKASTQTASTTQRMSTTTTRKVTTTSVTQRLVTTGSRPTTFSRTTTGSTSAIRNGPTSTTKLPMTSPPRQVSATSIVKLGYCFSNLKNIAVREGTLNVSMNVTANPCAVNWTVFSTSTEPDQTPITRSDCTVDPKVSSLYDVNGNGLIIRNSTAIDPQITTAGLYIADCGNNGGRTAAKLVVVHNGPMCSCSPDSTSSNIVLSCSVDYADYTTSPISAILTWVVNGVVQKTESPPRNRTDPYVYTATSTLAVDGSSVNNYQCILTFGAPTDVTDSFIAKNAPDFSASCSTQCPQSNGSLTRGPTNIASVTGSNNITLQCSSSRGTEAIRWSFTPFGGNETIWISNGSQLLLTNDLLYLLRTTVNSSVLIVRQVSNMTEGTYTCYDGVESASAFLLVTPLQISMEPLFGPIAGGTNITIIGLSAINQILARSGSYASCVKDVSGVYLGYDLSFTSLLLKSSASSAFELVAVTPSTTEASIGQPLPIIFEFSPTPFNMTFNRAFTYRPNPEIISLYPNQFILDGGTLLDVFGHGFSSVAKPIIQLTVFIYRSADNSTTSLKLISTTTTSRICSVPPGNDTFMQCPMPPLNLPGDFLENLNSLYNYTSTTRVKRETIPSALNCVLSVLGANGIDRADIVLGIIFDGFKKYENINDALPNTNFTYYSSPEITVSDELIEFDPSEDELIYVKGRYMMTGARIIDYEVLIGDQICINNELTDNQLSCRPPKVKPSSTINNTTHCVEHLSISITLGYKETYQYACLKYIDRAATKRFALIVGLTVGLAGLAFFLTLLIICILSCRRRRGSKKPKRRPKPRRQIFRNPSFKNDVYSESHEDQSRRRQDYDDNISVNEDYLNYFADYDHRSPYRSSVASVGNINKHSDAIYTNSREMKSSAIN